MIRCSKCSGSNLEGAVFCAECGALLPVPGSGRSAGVSNAAVQATDEAIDPWATLHLLESGHIVPLRGADLFTIGRSVDRQSTPPDIDLSDHDAYSNGVSRTHASIGRLGTEVVLVDLGSSNGTYVNGKRLEARQQARLANGDVISLGKFRIRVRLKAS